MADPQAGPQYSAEMRIRPGLVPALWDAHGRFMKEKQNPDCFSVVVEPKTEGVEIHYSRLTRHVETDPGYFEIRPVCPTARSITFHYDQSGRFLRLQWNR